MKVLAGAIKRGDVLMVAGVRETVGDVYRSMNKQKAENIVVQLDSGLVMILAYSDIVERV